MRDVVFSPTSKKKSEEVVAVSRPETQPLAPNQIVRLSRPGNPNPAHTLLRLLNRQAAIVQRLMDSATLRQKAGKPRKGLYSGTYKKLLTKLDTYHQYKNGYNQQEKTMALRDLENLASAFMKRKLNENKGTTAQRKLGLQEFMDELGNEIRGENPAQNPMVPDAASDKLYDAIQTWNSRLLEALKRRSGRDTSPMRLNRLKRTYARMTLRYITKWFERYGRQTGNEKALNVLEIRNQVETSFEGLLAEQQALETVSNPGQFESGMALFILEDDSDLFRKPRLSPEEKRKPEAQPAVDHVVQSSTLGDCFFLAALISVVQKQPGYVKGMLHVSKPIEKEDGTPEMVENEMGQMEQIVSQNVTAPAEVTVTFYRRTGLNNYTPVQIVVSGRKGDVGLDTSVNYPPWVMMLEKAYARYKGSYAAIQGGKGYEALEDLLGPQVKRMGIKFGDEVAKSNEVTMENIHKLYNKGFYVTVGTKESPQGDKDKKPIQSGDQISMQHQYAVTGVNTDAETAELRNPHGHTHTVTKQDLQYFDSIEYVET